MRDLFILLSLLLLNSLAYANGDTKQPSLEEQLDAKINSKQHNFNHRERTGFYLENSKDPALLVNSFDYQEKLAKEKLKKNIDPLAALGGNQPFENFSPKVGFRAIIND